MDESITVERVRHGLVVGRIDVDRDAVALAATLPPRRDRTVVVVGASAVDAVTRLDPWVVADIAEAAHGDLCVVAPNLGSMGPAGKLPPARLLADRLGVEVTAADGVPVGLADGSVFVPGRTPGWVSYRPGGRRIRVGARFPAPWWQHELPATLAEHVTEIPAGLWIRRPGAPERPDDPLFRQPPDRDRMYVVTGAPGEEPPTAAAVTEVLRALTDEGRDRAVLAGYGVPGMARAVADLLGAPVRAAHGVPGGTGQVYVDGAGQALWRPFALESVWLPGGTPVLNRWVAPAPVLAMAEPGSYHLVDGWRVDVVARGLVVRPESVAPDPSWAGETGPETDVLLAAGGPVPPEVIAAFDRLVRELPADARDRLRVVPVDPDATVAAAGTESADRVVPLAATRPPPDPPAAVEERPATGEEVAVSTSEGRTDSEVRVDGPVEPPAGAVVVTAQGRVLPAAPILMTARPVETAPAIGADRGEEAPAGAIPTVAAAATAPIVAPFNPPTRPAAVTAQAVAVAQTAAQPVVPAPLAVPPVASTMTPPVASPPSTTATATPPAFSGPATAPNAVKSTMDNAAASVTGLLPLREPRSPVVTQPPATRAAAPIEVPAEVRSTAEQRRAMRGKLGARYDVATRAVTRLLSERPGLRSGAGDHAALLAELAVVRVFAEDPSVAYDADFYVVLADGLRRLPTARAVVVRGIPAGTDAKPDTLIRLPAPVVAAPVLPARPVGPAEALIWTTTARRLDGLTGDETAAPDVVLSGHTRLRVLTVEAGRLLLAEDGAPREPALTRLRAAAAARAITDPQNDQPAPTRWFGALPTAA